MLSLLKPVLMPFQGSCGHASGCSRIKEMLGCWAAICWSRGEFNTGQGYTGFVGTLTQGRHMRQRHTGVVGTLRQIEVRLGRYALESRQL